MPHQYTPEERILIFWSKVSMPINQDDCWEWTGATRRGYGVMGAHRRSLYVHRISWWLAYGEIPDGLFVCHKCDNPKCVNPSHLFLGTTQDNTQDKVNKGRQHRPKGELSGTHKLTQVQVDYIRERYAQGGITQRKLAAEFGVKQQCISRVVKRLRWT